MDPNMTSGADGLQVGSKSERASEEKCRVRGEVVGEMAAQTFVRERALTNLRAFVRPRL